jgi:hypothetical protein
MLELVQQKFLHIIVGEGRNNFILEYNEERPEDPLPGSTPDDDYAFGHPN